ncbi:MAG: putative transposase for insertion sequence element [Actinomycetia bacterium]|nr:putative transposase for insertion sequence element [Actinomycetes bacterium]
MGLAYPRGMERISIPALGKRVQSEADAYEFMEEMRWAGQPVCPHCGSVREHYFLTPKAEAGRATRRGKVSERRVWKCAACRRQFSVLTGTVMHSSKIPVKTWLFVIVEICSSKNGVSAREIQRKYELTPKTAWHMLHRLREAMKRGDAFQPMTGTIVADEAYIGGQSRRKYGHLRADIEHIVPAKAVVFTLINAESGEARSKVVPNVKGDTLWSAIRAQVDMPNSRLMTDESMSYRGVGREFGLGHDSVTHNLGEYVRGDVSTNRAENYFGQLKRSIDGTFHKVSHEHLDRYLAEFDFRYSTRKLTDTQRVYRLMGQVAGRRLAYRPLTNP